MGLFHTTRKDVDAYYEPPLPHTCDADAPTLF